MMRRIARMSKLELKGIAHIIVLELLRCWRCWIWKENLEREFLHIDGIFSIENVGGGNLGSRLVSIPRKGIKLRGLRLGTHS